MRDCGYTNCEQIGGISYGDAVQHYAGAERVDRERTLLHYNELALQAQAADDDARAKLGVLRAFWQGA